MAVAVWHAAKRVLQRPLDQRVTEVLELVRSVTGVAPAAPPDVVASEWAADPYSRGAYSFIRLGSSREDLEDLGERLGGRLLFAGEATGSARCGFADDGMITGIREAKRLLRSASVGFDPLGQSVQIVDYRVMRLGVSVPRTFRPPPATRRGGQ